MKTLRLNIKHWTRTAAVALVAVVSSLVVAQDYKTLQGSNQRTGDASLASPGRALLHYYRPVLVTPGDTKSIVRDNASSTAIVSPGWVAPALTDETGGSYRGYTTGNAAEDLVTGWDDPFVSPPDNPGYLYASTIPAGPGTDPTIKNFPADTLKTFEWVMEPFVPAERAPRNYALYVWLPVGPTGDGLGGLLFTQRYFVYEILYANGRRWIDVVDTYQAGGGWVRLGNGGKPTNQLFDYDGTNPIRIRLYNTVQRLNGHENDVVNSPLANWLSVYTDNPYTSVVYADAALAVPITGDIAATPIVSQIDPVNPLLGTHMVYARNGYTVGLVNGQTQTQVTGGVYSVDHASGAKRWDYLPLVESQFTTRQDNNGAGVTVQAPFIANTTEPNYQGTDYCRAPIVNVLGTESAVRYQPTLRDGTYEIYIWCPGTRGTEQLAVGTEVRVLEGATVNTFTVNQDVGGGWVRVGTRRFTHNATLAALEVQITNYSANVADLGRFAYADSVIFVGAANLSITSTPVHANALVRVTNGGAPTAANVVLVATEDGRIHCVDAVGNADGTTNVYWTYPSTPDPDNPGWTDPNAVATEDGGVATMPIGFDLSSALVQNIGGVDYLYIATRNGRVYCIEMAGRGDMNLATRHPGTTRRVWSYPDDFPATSQRTLLGPFTGSLTYGNPGSGPTIYAPTTQGRLYALDALPGGPNPNKVTTVRWSFPPKNQPTLGPIYMTPMFVGTSLYFGTGQKAGDDRGRFYAIDNNTGALQWEFNGTTQWDVAGGGVNFIPADDFVAGPAFGPVALTGAGRDMIYVANENRWITALNAATGAVFWTTNELQTTVLGNLTFTTLDAFTGGGGGARANAPVVMVPTADGRFDALYARISDLNRFGTKRAWEYVAAGSPIYSTLSVGRGNMYGADSAGYVYDFNDTGDGSNGNVNGPGTPTAVENDDSNPDIENFRSAKILFITKDTFQRLRLAASDANLLTYAQTTTDPTRVVTRSQFDWGEYLYVLAYDFPYDITTPPPPSAVVPPPIINYAFSVDGASFRNLSVESRQFRSPGTAPLALDGVTRLDGYAVLAFAIQGGGSNALPPGKASVTVSISTSAAANPPQQVNIGLNPLTARKDFGISNPIGLAMSYGDPLRQIGVDPDPSEEGRRSNGSPNLASTPLNREDLLGTSTGIVAHSRAGNVKISLVDTSLMTLLRGAGRGVDNVRFDRQDLVWRGGRGAVVKRLIDIPFYAAFYVGGKGMEDYPDEFPNPSLDYPDMDRERIRVLKDVFGLAENPVFNGVSLTPPTVIDENAIPFPTRTLNPTPFDLTVDVPRFQPPNLSLAPDSAAVNLDAGYFGRMSLFVDSDGSGTVTRGGGRREAFRTFWLGTSVAVDNSFTVETPTVDFGAVGSGTGYSPLAPQQAGSNYTPFPTPIVPGGFDYDRNAFPYTDLFRPIVVRNEGNVNLINLRLAKYWNQGGGLNPWEIFSANDHELLWLDSSLNMHASFDEQYALVPVPVLQKSRVGDLSGTLFSDIPYVRDNPNINAIAGFLFTPGSGGFPDVAREVFEKGPRIGISIPIGFPATRLSSIVRIFEDLNFDESLSLDANGNAVETAADPTVRVLATTRENRLTNGFTQKTAPMVENTVSTAVGNEDFTHVNSQPAVMRDRNGNLIAIFTSNRYSAPVGAGFDKSQPAAAINNSETRLYAVGLTGAPPSGAPTTSSIDDLNLFQPDNAAVWPNGRWWRRDVADFPTTPLATLFPGDPVLATTAKFGAPSLPGAGDTNPFTGAAESRVYLAFNGSVQKQGVGERYGDSRIFISEMTIAPNGAVTLGQPVGLPNDPQMAKGRPSIIQSSPGGTPFATVFFPVAGTGQGQIHYAVFDGANWRGTQVLQTGAGFETVGAPNVSGRVYQGVASPGTAGPGQNILEIAFYGKLRGRPAAEIFFGRMRYNTGGGPGYGPSGLVFFPQIQNERLVADTETGVYRSSGVVWNGRANIQLFQSLNGGPLTDLEVPNTRAVDTATGIIHFDTILGGKAYLNPSLGTVRLANSLPARSAQLYLSYQPRFLRVSAGGAAYGNPNLMFDNRLIGELSYWATNTNTAVTAADAVRPSRFVFTYSRAAETSQVARPYFQTVRAGIQLPTGIATNQDGAVVNLTVTGATSFFQVDPANGRLYFTDADENRTVTVSYTGFDDAGNPVVMPAAQYTIALLTERSEAPIAVDQPANETQLATYLDPFEGTLGKRRPGLFWLFWTSTRVGSPDVYFETIAPRFTPKARN